MSARSVLHATFPIVLASIATACGDGTTGPVDATGGVGASPSGGASSGGSSTGGSTGGLGAGGTQSGGAASGGTQSGGAASGGAATGGADAGGSGGAASTGGSGAGGDAGGSGGAPSLFALSGPGWQAVDNDDCSSDMPATCPVYPQDNTTFGANVSPEMSWTPGPEGTLSYAMTLVDLSNGLTHWAIWNIPAETTLLAAELPGDDPLTDPAGARQGTGFGMNKAYFGSGKCGNVYEHRLYALSVATLPESANSANAVRTELEAGNDVLGETFVRLQSRDYCTID